MERLFQALDEVDDLLGVLRYRWMAFRSGRPAALPVRKRSQAAAALASRAAVAVVTGAPARSP